MGNNPTRAGFRNFLIRGIGGNRVLPMSDGMRMADFPETNMGAGTYTREQPDPEDIKRVEIIRGPASALYGSDPGDYMRDGRNIYLDPALLSSVFATPIVRLQADGTSAFLSPG